MSNSLAIKEMQTELPALVDRARSVLENARGAAEVLEARDRASVAYDAAKKATRLARAKGAHDELIAAGHRVQADALEIEARAKRRLADEYDAAQERGEIRTQRDNQAFSASEKARGSDFIQPKELHEARIIRDAEEAQPGIIREALDEALQAGEEPTKAKVRRAVLKVTKKKSPNRKPKYSEPEESQHDRDLRMLLGIWEAACASSREAFLEIVNQ